MKKKDLLVLSALRRDGRNSLTKMSREIHVPVSTIFDKMRQFKGNLITGYTALVDFALLGFNTRAVVMIKVDRVRRNEIKEYLCGHDYVNSVFKINNGFDFMFECVFRNIKDMEDFLEIIDKRFEIIEKNVYYIIEDVQKESFLANFINA